MVLSLFFLLILTSASTCILVVYLGAPYAFNDMRPLLVKKIFMVLSLPFES
jgi:hypothetical protein